MEYGLLCGLWVWRIKTNRRPCRPPMPNPSTSPRTARPDGSERWDNRLAAQHLPRNRAWPSSGQKSNSLKRKKNNVDLKNNNRNYRKSFWTFWVLEKLQWLCFKSILINYEITDDTVMKNSGVGGASAPPTVSFAKNQGNILENPRKNGAQRCLTSKNVPQSLQKNPWRTFWRPHQ